MVSDMERLQRFNECTFWRSLNEFLCFQAARRSYNVDRFFIGISRGGVGQSLYSLRLSEMYKHNHPNI